MYLYILYCNLALIKNKKIGSFVESGFNLLRNMKLSSHVQTKLWILEILYTFSERISFKELGTEFGKLKSEFQELCK